MIGFFDSGIGGLEVMKRFRSKFPELDMVYFGDRANCPYGDKSGNEIRSLTERWVAFLFEQGASIVIIACNTGAAYAVRPLQNTLRTSWSSKQVLSVTIPGAEKAVEMGAKHIWVLATKATVDAHVYQCHIELLDPSVSIQEVSASGLVNILEAEARDVGKIREILAHSLTQFSPEIDTLILGCTHYPMIQAEIAQTWQQIHGTEIHIVDPAEEAAERFTSYIQRHPEFPLTYGGKETIFFSDASTA